MDLFVLDTNVYVEALRNRDILLELKEFLTRAGMRVRLDGVVAAELFAGAVSVAHADAVKDLVTPYRLRGWTIAPSFAACVEAGRVLAAIRSARSGGRQVLPPSLLRDALIAASCREVGAVLVTNNTSDFRRIQRHLRGFRFLAPWPLMRRGA